MEELGLVGSSRYVEVHRTDSIRAMLNFDVNASGDTVLFGPSARPESARLRRAVRDTCAAEEVDCIAFPEMPPSDDRPFVSAGIPTVSIAVLPAVEAHQTWLLVNGGAEGGLAQDFLPGILRTIHTPQDTVEQVDEATMTRMLHFARTLLAAAARD
jgi:Zn-dependent M28 family amino/carboxypeptidase